MRTEVAEQGEERKRADARQGRQRSHAASGPPNVSQYFWELLYEQANRPEQGGFFPISSEALVGRVTRPLPLLGCAAPACSFVHFVIYAV